MSDEALSRIVAKMNDKLFDKARAWALKCANLGCHKRIVDWVRREIEQGRLTEEGKAVRIRPARPKKLDKLHRLPKGYTRLPNWVPALPGDIYYSLAISKWIPTIAGHITEQNRYARPVN